MIEIIGAPQSVYVRTVRMALEEKGVSYVLTSAAPHSSDVCAINPFGKIPAMRHGTFELFESKAIATYVDLTFAGPRLVPEDAKLAARTEQWISAINTSIFPRIVGYMQANAFAGDGGPDQTKIHEMLPGVRATIEIVGRAVEPGGHLVDDDFTLADVFLMPILAYLRMFPDSAGIMRSIPALGMYFDRHARRLSFVATTPPPLSALNRA